MPSKNIFILLWLIFSLPAVGFAEDDTGNFQGWVRQFALQAETQGISHATLQTALSDIEFLPGVIEADRRQPEFKKSLSEYLAERVTKERIVEGRRLLGENRQLLKKIFSKYRVPPHYLIALWGIETNFGRNTGKVPILSALATLAYEGRRGEYFRQELFYVLRLLDSGKLAKSQLFGSWAGAMGNVQFMPSTFINFAVDGDRDGKIDLWESRADSLASAANYLHKSGWTPRQKWGRKVRIPQNIDREKIGVGFSDSLKEWQKLGVRRINGRNLPTANFLASLVVPEGSEGEGFLVYDNYRVLLKWNRADSFALAVGLLADQIAVGNN